MTKPKSESMICATCGHHREHHWKLKGSCRLETGKRFCGCSHFRRLRWGKIRRAIIDGILNDVRFRAHADPYDGGKLNQRIEMKLDSLHSTIWGVCERFTETNLVVVRRTDL